MTRRDRQSTAQYLDNLVPLDGASHSDVIDYCVAVPMRYAEVQARLADGSTARLANSRQFIGWTGYGTNPTLLFDCGDRNVVVDTGREKTVPPELFISRDGGQISSSAAL